MESDQPHRVTAFDAYACAALTGLLANQAVIADLAKIAYINGTENKLQDAITGAAMEYASLAMKMRPKCQPTETTPL